jgi:two-component system, chemotaxis family, chemotaxis protein CheY
MRFVATTASLTGQLMATRDDLKLLIVEDREVMLKIIRRLLVQLGFSNIDGAANGVRALEKLGEKNYDLILSDWNMDEMSGFELLKHVRADSRTANIPFILVTAEAKPENIMAAKAAGANAYLLKPFKLDMLQQTIEDVLSENAAA